MTVLLLVVAFVLIVASLCSLRIASWHLREAKYWLDASVDVLAAPVRDSYYRPLLAWTKAHPPSVLTRLRRWQPPWVRRDFTEATGWH